MNMSEKIIAYKAMDKNMQCRGKQYEVGKTYHEDEADCRNAGMHACENPLDVLHYYPLRDSPRFFEVECGGCQWLFQHGGCQRLLQHGGCQRLFQHGGCQRLLQHGGCQWLFQHGGCHWGLLQSKSRWKRQCRSRKRRAQ